MLVRPRPSVQPGAGGRGLVPLGGELGLGLVLGRGFMPHCRPLGSHLTASDFPVPGITPLRPGHSHLFTKA